MSEPRSADYERVDLPPCQRCGHSPDWHRLDDSLNVSPTDPEAEFRCWATTALFVVLTLLAVERVCALITKEATMSDPGLLGYPMPSGFDFSEAKPYPRLPKEAQARVDAKIESVRQARLYAMEHWHETVVG